MEMRMTPEPEPEGQGAREMESAFPSELVSPHLTRHKLQGDPAPQTVRCELLLLFIGAGNVDSGHVLQWFQLSYCAESLGASSSPHSAEAFEGLILVGWHLCPPGFAMNIFCWCNKPSLSQNHKGKQMRSV